jgi:chondroitin AC lyase
MGAYREVRYLFATIVIIAACTLAPVGICGASGPGGRPQAKLAAAGGSWPGAVPDDLGLILRRLKAQVLTPNYPGYSHVPGEGAPRASRAPDYLSSIAADGHWPDLNYEGARANWNAHLSRMAEMAGAYANSASPDYHSAKMLEAVEHALDYWFTKRKPVLSNWWENTIGQPLLLTRTLVPLEDVLPPDMLRKGLSYYTCSTDVDPRYATGENLVWFAQQQLIRGILARSPEDIAAGGELIQREIRINAGEGIQRDFSFHQHGPQLYNGGYGHDFVVDTCKYATLLQDTRYAFTHEKLSLLADLLLEGDGHMLRGKLLDYSAFGRTLVRRDASTAALEFELACDELAALLPERAAALGALKEHIAGTGAPASFVGNKFFWNSDFMTHQRDAYYMSVKMISNRTVGTETIHGENAKGCWLPFGTTWILRRGDEYKDIFPVLDWGRLPGVTSPHMTEPFTKDVRQPEPFVGGVTDGTYGAAAMVFGESESEPLVPLFRALTHGQKAWFFFDREIVALGAGITSTRDEPIGTTLNQTLLHGPVLMDGHEVQPGEAKVSQTSWVLHDEVGYTLLGPTDATLKVGPQTGDWKSVGSGNSTAPVTESVFAMWIDHGVHPSDAKYAYAVLPAIKAKQLAAWVAHPPVRVISNTTAQQAVINDQAAIAEIVFYRPGSVTLMPGVAVIVDHPCMVLLVKHGDSTRIAVSSPGGEVSRVHLTLTNQQNAQHVTFELPDGDEAGKSQTKEVPVSLAEPHPPSAKPNSK